MDILVYISSIFSSNWVAFSVRENKKRLCNPFGLWACRNRSAAINTHLLSVKAFKC